MSKIIVLSVVLFAAVGVLPAVPVACPESGALTMLTAMTADGCQSQDMIFSNFVYAGDVAAADVNINLVLQTGISNIHGWSFIPETAWVEGFTLSYDITVAPGYPLAAIIQSKDQMNSGDIPNGVSINDIQTGVTPSPLALSGATGIETVYSNLYNLQTVHTATTATVAAGSNLLSYEQNFVESTGIPEPVSFVLIGAGLVGLALSRRRRASKS
jgi:hypothetical protein